MVATTMRHIQRSAATFDIKQMWLGTMVPGEMGVELQASTYLAKSDGGQVQVLAGERRPQRRRRSRIVVIRPTHPDLHTTPHCIWMPNDL